MFICSLLFIDILVPNFTTIITVICHNFSKDIFCNFCKIKMDRYDYVYPIYPPRWYKSTTHVINFMNYIS